MNAPTLNDPLPGYSNEEFAKIYRVASERERKVLDAARMLYVANASPGGFASVVSKGAWKWAPHLHIINNVLVEAASRQKFVIVSTSVRAGKALHVGTPIAVAEGWKKISDIVPGDFVFNEKGEQVEVLGVSPIEMRESYDVVFNDGSVITACKDHEWTVIDKPTWDTLCDKKYFSEQRGDWATLSVCPGPQRKSNYGPVTLTTEVMSQNVMHNITHNHANFTIPTCLPLSLPEANLPVDPYVLGYWLGDGNSSSETITVDEKDIGWVREEFERRGVVTSNRKTPNTFGFLKHRNAFHTLGLLNNKHVPNSYMRSSVTQRMDLLRGLMDSDGGVERGRRVSFTNTKRHLVESVFELMASLGMKPVLDSRDAKLNGKICGTAYRVSCTAHTNVFSMPRKSCLWKSASSRSRNQTGFARKIVDIIPVGTQPVCCIAVDSPTQLYLAGESMVPTHNSELASRYNPAWFMGRHPDKNVMIASYSANLATSLGRYSRDLFDEWGDQIFAKKVRQDSRAADDWGVEGHKGRVFSVGVGGSITGKGGHCIAGSTKLVTTAGIVTAENLFGMDDKPAILSYDHISNAPVFKAVTNEKVSFSTETIVVTVDDTSITVTPEHRVFVEGKGYVEASDIGIGDVLLLHENVYDSEVRVSEADSKRAVKVLLQQGMFRQELHANTSLRLRCPKTEAQNVLFQRMRSQGIGFSRQKNFCVSAMPDGIFSKGSDTEILQPDMFGCSPFGEDVREHDSQGSGTLATVGSLRDSVRKDTPADIGAGRSSVRCLSRGPEASRPSFECKSSGQYTGEPDYAVPERPYEVTQVVRAAVRMVERRSHTPVAVYDFTVEDTNNFFADQILVHNCIIIDDPIKNLEDAFSGSRQEKLRDWYSSVLRTRLEPGGSIILIMSRWAKSDLAGWILDNQVEFGDQWEEIRLPMIAEEDDDIIGRKIGEPLWPERYSLQDCLKIKHSVSSMTWNALYQQNPISQEDSMFPYGAWKYCDAAPLDANYVRRWDLSASVTGDFSAGVLMCRDAKGFCYVVDVQRVRMAASDTEKHVRYVAEMDKRYPNVRTIIEQAPGAGVAVAENYIRNVLAGFNAESKPTRGDKRSNAAPAAAQVQAGNVFLVRALNQDGAPDQAKWWKTFQDECFEFKGDGAGNDDMVDAFSHGYQDLALGDKPPPKFRSRIFSPGTILGR